MSQSLLTLVQTAAGEMNLAVPSSVVGNTTQDVVTMYYLANGLGRNIAKQFDWQALATQYIFTVQYTTITGDTVQGSSNITNASSIVGLDTTYQVSGLGINQATYIASAPSGATIPLSQPATSTNTGATYTLTKVKYAKPADYDRQIDRTHWDKSKHWEMLGPLTPQQWEWLISGYISTGPRMRYRWLGDKFQIWPPVGTAEVLGFEYISNYWARSSTDVAQASMTADTDTCIWPDQLMTVGLKNAYFQLKGFGDTYKAEYESLLAIAKSNDQGSQTLSFAPRASSILVGWENIPDSGYGS